MSRLDEWENRRGPVKRWRRPAAKRPPRPKETQLALKLMGGMTERERKEGTPFDDPLPF